MSDDLKLLGVINVAQTYIACTTSILIWDWLSCLPQEWKYIWKSNRGWSPVKILYCLVRYYTLAVLIVTDVWFFAKWSEASCAKYVRILPGIAVPIDLSVELVLAVRIYALYGCNKRVGAFLGVLIAGFLGVMIAVPILAFDYTRLPSWPGPCVVTGKPSIAGPKFIIAFYASPMTFDIIMTAMTVYKVMDHTRHGWSSSLMNRMLRDGLFYFFAITSLNLLNVIFFIQPNELIQAINAPMSIQISSVLCCRLILDLRSENQAKAAVRKYSNTRGRWVTDIIQEEFHNQDTLQFSGRSPGAQDPESQVSTQDGITKCSDFAFIV
ncbi:hypothetical protein B0H16DRAFT_1529267 [Mycena metata]|uniref:DUF6533 domain-containing protein n=1 Tax=Mycena metata TaxID=1033252 RepID=A0AAD7NIV6_9AGAR|nr:hypothetical protein B0H16DRAFT_1529267 [Mycena metata]